MGSVERFEDTSRQPAVRGYLHRPEMSQGRGLVLTHGASGNCGSPLLVALATTFADRGYTILRCDLPFRQKRASGSPFGTGAEDRAGLHNAVEALRTLLSGPVFLGGHSYGGRQASMLAADEPQIAGGLLLLSYPLHPPGNRSNLRTAHFPSLQIPALFVHGSRDPFGSDAEVRTALPLIPAKTTLLMIEGAGHDLGFRPKKSSAASGLPQQVVGAFEECFGPIERRAVV